MPASDYVVRIRKHIGHDLLILPSVSVLIFDAARKLLLVRSVETGNWMTVGGQIEPFEPPADAVVRECWEETGFLVEPTRIVGVFGGPEYEMEYPNGDRTVYTSTCFEAKIVSGTPKPDLLETAELGWFSADEVSDLPMTSLTQDLLSHAFSADVVPQFRKPSWTPPDATT